jgi:type II secretory pathway predicted ATPase ExeA
MSGSTFFAQHFGLRERPFTLLPDPDFLYWSPSHKRAFTILEYGLMTCAPITVITGEVGAGKTTLLQKLLTQLDPEVTVGLISNAQGGRGDLLHWVLNALGLEVSSGLDYVGKFRLLQEFIIDEFADGRRVLLIIDEAQNLSIEGLEELRMLTNINSNKDELLQLVLVGQPELREMITRPELRQFAQRVTASFHLPALDRETTAAYVRHRLKHAGGTGEEFTDAAIAAIHDASRGVPRLVNKLCDFSMAYALAADETLVDAHTVSDVLADDIFVDTRAEPEPEPETGGTVAQMPLRLERKVTD